ncbi:MAG: TetR/AcrR family transcriptional regulator [Lachnospiraceae bacterium]|nr:TetR/AcrR family transcriptional regulator [Lachnospiraceae bacterium]
METKEKIIHAAKEEFIQHGYENASLRRIASFVGISAAALYRHFCSKEEIFDAVVAPAVQDWEQFIAEEIHEENTILQKKNVEAIWGAQSKIEPIIDMIYANFPEQKLLFFGSVGTKYENYLYQIVRIDEQETINFMKGLEAMGITVNQINEKEMHLILLSQYQSFFEILRQDFSYEEAKHFAKTLCDFHQESWRRFLGF